MEAGAVQERGLAQIEADLTRGGGSEQCFGEPWSGGEIELSCNLQAGSIPCGRDLKVGHRCFPLQESGNLKHDS